MSASAGPPGASLRDELSAGGAEVVVEQVAGGEALRVSPSSVAALGRAVAVLRARKLPVRVWGAADAPAAPAAGGVLLELHKLNRIASVDGKTCIARVEAGCSVAALEAAARRERCTLGPLLPMVWLGSVGAWLAGPTRGERGIPGSRRETAALSVAAVLSDGRIAESRAAPRSATGPDLDHLALGGGGRLCVIAAAWVRLFPEAPVLASAWSVRSLAAAVEAVERLCLDRLAPGRARAQAEPGGGARLVCAWEGLSSARIARERAAYVLRGLGCAQDTSAIDAAQWVRGTSRPHAVEVDGSFPALGAWAAQEGAAAAGAELRLLGLHAGGAFAVLAPAGAADADECATAARGFGARVLSPRRLRDAGPGWGQMGAGAVWQRLIEALGAEEAP